MIEQLSLELDLFFEDPPAEVSLLSITLPWLRRPFSAPVVPEHGIYWHNGNSHTRRVALGDAWSITLRGAERFADAEQHFNQLQSRWTHLDPEESGQHPQLFFQYAFDAEDPMDGPWRGLPNTLLQLPRISLSNQQGHQWITLSHPVDGNNRSTILEQWQQDLQALQDLLDTRYSEVGSPLLTPAEPSILQGGVVGQAIETIQQGEIEKIVCTAESHYQISSPPPLQPTLKRMERRNQNGIQQLYTIPNKQWIAAPPEQLVKKTGTSVEAEALAGTVPRGHSKDEELALEQQLLNDPKLQQEHRLVAQFIQQQLTLHCGEIDTPQPPRIQKLGHVQHLLTPFKATLKHPHSLFALAKSLHQSPAICGTPKHKALEWLRQHDNGERGYYCGGAGWIDSEGDGEIHVLLRCGLATDEQLHLYAGAGIVAGSNIDEEEAEITLKIQGMLDTLNHATA